MPVELERPAVTKLSFPRGVVNTLFALLDIDNVLTVFTAGKRFTLVLCAHYCFSLDGREDSVCVVQLHCLSGCC